MQTIRQIRVLAMIHRTADQETDPTLRDRCRVTEWEIPLAEVVFEDKSA
jgi:hypothetical protein